MLHSVVVVHLTSEVDVAATEIYSLLVHTETGWQIRSLVLVAGSLSHKPSVILHAFSWLGSVANTTTAILNDFINVPYVHARLPIDTQFR